MNQTAPKAFSEIEYEQGEACPVHEKSLFKKLYTFGSTMSAETEVCVFKGCKCAIATKHDPVGTYPSVSLYCEDYSSAAGVGRLHAMMAAAKYR